MKTISERLLSLGAQKQLITRQVGDSFEVEIADDGSGIDWDRVYIESQVGKGTRFLFLKNRLPPVGLPNWCTRLVAKANQLALVVPDRLVRPEREAL